MIALIAAATLFFAGDSTLDDNGFRIPYRSWGRELGSYMKAGCSIGNFAKSGHSTKSFEADGHWTQLISSAKSGDFVVIQFGHNDQKRSTPYYAERRWADPNGLFMDIVRKWVGEVRAKGATPILASPICRATFDKDGKKLIDTVDATTGINLGSYRDAMASLAAELKCDYVDMNTLTRNLMERIGREESEKFFVISTGLVLSKDGEPAKDVTHPIKAGAEAFARLFVDDVKKRGLSVAALFRNAEFEITDLDANEGVKATEAFAAAMAGCNVDVLPLMAMRLRANDTETPEIWKSNYCEIARHPGCCDEIWFSTGCGAPSLDWHRARAAVIADAMVDAKAAGITPSLQFQATLGHGDRLGTPEMFSMKTWTGWTGWSGIEAKYCNCPRQPAFHAYLREVSKIYAPLGFASLWIDDDLRIAHHQPSDSYGRHVGCWCKTCLTAFNAETGATWTRDELAKAVETDDALFARWRKFSVDGLCIVARTIAEAFHELSPDTMMALQHGSGEDSADQVAAVLKALHEISGHCVGFRPGGGNYYDDDPNGVVCKSIGSGWFRNRIGNPSYVKVWTPEIESWPRTYYSRSPQGVLVEGFSALMSGMNAISFFISNSAMEDPSLYGRTYWKSLAEASPVLRGYAKTIDGCTAVGFVMPGDPQIGIRRAAIPVLPGPGRSVGVLTKADCERNVNKMTSSEVQAFRDDLDRRAGGLPALVQSSFMGLLQVHVDSDGGFRCLALLNMRISEQGPVRILLRKVPSEWTHVVWKEMRRSPVRLSLERRGDDSFATIPLVGAWNGGYLYGVSDFASQRCERISGNSAKPL